MLPLQAAFLDQAGRSEFSNRQLLEDYDMTTEELVAWQTSGAITSTTIRSSTNSSPGCWPPCEMFDATVRMHDKDGGYRWMRCCCVPCRDAHGNIARYVTVQSDVHDLKHAEDLLAAEVKLLEMVARGELLGDVLDTLRQAVEALCSAASARCSLSPRRPRPSDRSRSPATFPVRRSTGRPRRRGDALRPGRGRPRVRHSRGPVVRISLGGNKLAQTGERRFLRLRRPPDPLSAGRSLRSDRHP